MIEKVRKRSGYYVKYHRERIENALKRASLETKEFDEAEAERLSLEVEQVLSQKGKAALSVEEIQDEVEKVLFAHYPQTAKAYILYRDKRRRARDLDKILMQDLVWQYLNKDAWQVKENANVSYSVQGMNMFLLSKVSSKFWLNEVFPSHVVKAHESGAFHIHDLQGISPYCAGWDANKLLVDGFRGPSDKVACGPPKHFSTVLNQLLNALFTLQQEFMGAQAFSDIDYLLAPYIRADKLGYKEVKQEIESLVYSLNVPARTGGQTPFSNFTCHLDIPAHLKYKPALYAGKPLPDATYSDFKNEADMINKAFSEVFIKGDADGKPFTFPLVTYNLKDVPNNKDFLRVEAEAGPYYIGNYKGSSLDENDTYSMCCRLRINKEFARREGGYFSSAPLTGSQGVVTINLPHIAYESKAEEDFFANLAYILELCYTVQEIRRKTLETLFKKGLFPYAGSWLQPIFEATGKYLANHFSTIGIVGMNEATLSLFGKPLHECLDFSEKAVLFVREKCLEFTKRSKNLYNVEQTPAEGAATSLFEKDCKHFASKVVGEGAYTNSTHLPADLASDLELDIKVHDRLDPLYTGGSVMHIFIGEQLTEEHAAKLIDTILNSKIPYATLTPTFGFCPVCKKRFPGKVFTCPVCKAPAEIYSRVVGYYRPVKLWNEGKQAEFKRRKLYGDGDHS